MIQKNSSHFYESNGILFVIFRVTKLKIRILQVYTFFCYFCQFRKSKNIAENIPLTSAWTGQRSNHGQHAIWAVRMIRRTRMNLRNLTQFKRGRQRRWSDDGRGGGSGGPPARRWWRRAPWQSPLCSPVLLAAAASSSRGHDGGGEVELRREIGQPGSVIFLGFLGG
jgi:hypothetical protein